MGCPSFNSAYVCPSLLDFQLEGYLGDGVKGVGGDERVCDSRVGGERKSDTG